MKYALVAGILLLVAGIAAARPLLLQYRLAKARQALEGRDSTLALDWLDAAAGVDSACGDVAFLRARCYRRLGDLEQVKQHLLRAAEREYPLEALEREKLLTMAQEGQLPSSSPEFAALMTDSQGDTLEIYEAVVRGYLETYQVASAHVLLDGWQGDYPDDPLPYHFRGLIWENEGAWPEAIEEFREALRRAPQRQDTRLHLAHCLRRNFQYRQACWHYEQCLWQEESPEALLGRGKCLEALSDREGARQMYTRVLELEPDSVEGRLALGELVYSLGEYREAVDHLAIAAEQDPSSFNVQHTFAWALLILGEKEKARAHFQNAVRLQEAMLRVANLQDRAFEEPGNADLRFEIGVELMQNHRPSDALVWLQSAIQLQPNHRGAHLALAEYFTRQGNAKAAEQHRLAAAGQP